MNAPWLSIYTNALTQAANGRRTDYTKASNLRLSVFIASRIYRMGWRDGQQPLKQDLAIARSLIHGHRSETPLRYNSR